ncbi:MAG: alpha/beta fold hydrolase [Haloarculaceae archaeon]
MTLEDPTPLPADWTAGTVHANGIDQHYVRTGGDGPPLVIAHGVFDDGPCRTPLARDLADDYDVFLPDARGHGRSAAPESGYGAADRAADLLALLDALEIEDPILFGHSMGGDTVAAAAARRPDVPRAVVLEDPGAMLEPEGDRDDAVASAREQIEWWHDHTKAELLEADEELAGHVAAGEEELAARLADARLRVSPRVAGVFEHDLLDPGDVYPDVTAPTLVLKADADAEGRERDRERAAHFPDGRLVHVDDTGHCVLRDDRATATRELRTFLEDR